MVKDEDKNNVSLPRMKSLADVDAGAWHVLQEARRREMVTQRVMGCETTKYNAMLDLLELEASGESNDSVKQQMKQQQNIINQMDARIVALASLVPDRQFSQ